MTIAVVLPVEPLWMTIARAELGVRELVGAKHNPRIIEYAQSCKLHAQDDETPWCSEFVNWCFMKAGVPRTESASALSWLHYGVELQTPRVGCIVVMARAGQGTGHVAFYAGEKDSHSILILGGNQMNRVCVEPHARITVKSYRWPVSP